MRLPALTDSRTLRLLAFGGLYVAQGIPVGLFFYAIPTWLAANGFSSGQVGSFIAVVTLPWALKLITGPVMDRFSFLAMGRRRPWILLAQLGIFVGCLFISSGITSFYWILAVGFCINFCAAWQDVAVDGMAIDVLDEEERARAAAFMFGGQIVGISGSSALSAILMDQYGIGVAGIAMAISVSLIALIPLLLRERPGERLLPWSEGGALPRSLEMQQTEWAGILIDVLRVLILPMSLLIVIVKLGDSMLHGVVLGVLPVLTTQDLGFDATFYPEWNAIAGVIAAAVGVVVAPFVDRVQAKRAIVAGMAGKAVLLTAFAVMSPSWANETLFAAFIITLLLLTQWLKIATIALCMSLCAPSVSTTQFAIYMALSNLGAAAGASLLGPLDAELTFTQMFYLLGALHIVFIVAMLAFRLEHHQSRLRTLFPVLAR